MLIEKKGDKPTRVINRKGDFIMKSLVSPLVKKHLEEEGFLKGYRFSDESMLFMALGFDEEKFNVAKQYLYEDKVQEAGEIAEKGLDKEETDVENDR